MQIHFERTGGFAGTRLSATIDTATLSADQVNTLRGLIEAAHFFDLPAQLPASPQAADQFHYRVTIEDEGKRHTVETDEGSASPALQALLQQLALLARFARGT